jgi:hypothetical protein
MCTNKKEVGDAVTQQCGEPEQAIGGDLCEAGRVCAADYLIDSSLFAGEPEVTCDVLYVVGGLYGNQEALRAVENLAAGEKGSVQIIFNGDLHWFDKTADNFERLEELARPYRILVGNVEMELRREHEIGVGCGCAYPASTPDAVVSRSNEIHGIMRQSLAVRPDLKMLMQDRPAVMTVLVGDSKVAVSHGDEKLVAGWSCSRESLQEAQRQEELCWWMTQNAIEVFAVTHTCTAAAIALDAGIVINNGAAGMPCFKGEDFGLITRIATNDHPEALYRARREGLVAEALPARYDKKKFLAWFDDLWPQHSAAAISYRTRILTGPDDMIANALLGGFEVCEHKKTSFAAKTK